MHHRVVRVALRALVAASVLAASIAPLSATAQESTAPDARPEINGPWTGCGLRMITGNDPLTFGGFATAGSTVTRAVIQQFDSPVPLDGDPVGTPQNVSVTIASDGSLSGDLERLAEFAASARSIAMLLTVSKDGVESPPGQSEPLLIDRERPFITQALTTSPTTIEVHFNEQVMVANGDSPLDWFIYGDDNRRPMMVTGTGDMRVLRFDNESFGEDELVPLTYQPTQTLRQAYRDCVTKILTADRTHSTVDGILPEIPLIAEINSADATDDRVAGRETQPLVRITGLSPGHKAELWRETNGTVGLQSTDQKIGVPVTGSGGAATIQSPALTPNDEYTFYARAIDEQGNISDGADSARYRLDTIRPLPTSANTDDSIVTVAFDDSLASGRNSRDDWTITVAGVVAHPTQVTGTGSTRQLHAAQVPDGALVSYTRPAADGYADEAGNELESFESVLVKGLVPTTVDLEPETADESVNEDHELVVAVRDGGGTLVPGATVSLRSVSGPSSDRNMDGDPVTPVGYIDNCRTGSDGTCTFSYTANGVGTDVLQSWLGTAGSSPQAEPREASGAELQNGQDVGEVEWHLEGTTVTLDATPESGSGPTNAPSVTTVRVVSVGGPAPNTPIAGINVDGRVLQGPNQGLRLGECHTKGDGTCTIAYTSIATGTDRLQFWIDADEDDSTVDELALGQNESPAADTNPGPLDMDDDAQDVTIREWAGSVVPVLQLEPESSTGQVTTTRSLVFSTVAQGSTTAIAGLNVDARVLSGPNAGAYLGECTTDGSGRCTLANYVSSTPGTDVIQGWIDATDDDVSTEVEQFEARDESTSTDEPDQDVVEATWTGGSPNPSASPTTTASPNPSPSPSETGQVGDRSVSMSTSSARVAFREPVTLSGQVEMIAGCSSTSVEILRRSMSGGDFTDFAVARSDASGRWVLEIRPRETARYRARVAGEGACQAARSDDVVVSVRSRIVARIDRAWAQVGKCALIRGRVAPGKAGQSVKLQQRTAKGWKKVAGKTLNTRSRYRFHRCPAAPGRMRFRVKWAGDDLNLAAVSRTLRLRMYR